MTPEQVIDDLVRRLEEDPGTVFLATYIRSWLAHGDSHDLVLERLRAILRHMEESEVTHE